MQILTRPLGLTRSHFLPVQGPSLRLSTELDPSLTVLSVGGIGAFDLVSRQAMLAALHPATTVVSLDGRSAYDSASRSAFLRKLRDVAPELVPFVRMFYGRTWEKCW